jgi:hypothetical protein
MMTTPILENAPLDRIQAHMHVVRPASRDFYRSLGPAIARRWQWSML